EILVSIAILGIIATISTPTIAKTYENMQKDDVLDQALQIERAAEKYCLKNEGVCTVGEEIPNDDIEPYLNGLKTDHTYSVKRTGLRDYAVHFASSDAFSFPYDEDGKLISKELKPSSGNRDMVNKPASFEGEDPSFDFPEWTEGSFETGDRVLYDDKVFEIRDESGIHNPPEPSNLQPYGPFQEVEIGNEYRNYNTYYAGDTVTYDGMTYEMNHEGGNGQYPDETFAWNALTSTWQPTNDYDTGDTVNHEGETYKAHHGGADGIEPGSEQSRGVWQNISSEAWVPTNIYNDGDRVEYNGVVYEAQWYTDQDEPGNSAVWSVVQDEGGGVSPWNSNTVYLSGDQVRHDETLYEAQWYTVGENPSHHSGPYQVWQPVEE
ncbi:MAG: carbohydrate-binding protein, partial [Candidatus Izemoplasmataceae bacterium]